MMVNSADKLNDSDNQPNHQLIEGLRQKIQSVTSAQRVGDTEVFSSGCRAVDQLLPSGGYSRGAIAQWFQPPSHKRNFLAGGYGAKALSLIAARNACKDGQALVVIDPDHSFNPPAVAALGISLGSLIVLRPPQPCLSHKCNDLLWAIDQSLRCPAVGAVWGHVGATDDRWLRRFQLSAEQTGTVGLFIRPGECAHQPSWSEIDWQVEKSMRKSGRPSQRSHSTFTRLHLLRAPGGRADQRITLEINIVSGSVQVAREQNEKSPLRLASQLAHSTFGRGATGA